MQRLRIQHILVGFTAVLLFAIAGPLRVWFAQGAYLGSRSITMSDDRAGTTATYVVRFTGQTASTVGSVRVQFCANTPLVGAACTAPGGFDASHATLSMQSGMTGFTVDTADTTANVIVLSRTPGSVPTGPVSYQLEGVVNPAVAGSFFARIETFATSNASGTHADYGGIAMATVDQSVSISTYVPPYLLFCTAITIDPYDCTTAQGDYIDFGNFSPNAASTGHTKILASSNADTGYTIRAVGTTLTSGNNIIPALTSPDVSRNGVSQFGLNLRSNSTPNSGSDPQGPGAGVAATGYNTANFYQFNSGDIVATATAADDYRMYTADYVVNVSKDQPPGVYVSTITYICLANF